MTCPAPARCRPRSPQDAARRGPLLDDISRHELVTLSWRVLRVYECRIAFQRHSFYWYVARYFVAHAVDICHLFIIFDFTLTLFFSTVLTVCDVRRNHIIQTYVRTGKFIQ